MQIATLIKKVIAEVKERDALVDESEEYRAQAIDSIEAAMKQYAALLKEHQENLPPRLQAIHWSLLKYVDSRYRHSYSYETRSPGMILSEDELYSDDLDPTKLKVSVFPEYEWKCNKFVADAYAVGASVGLSVGRNWGGEKITGNGYPASYDFETGKYMWPPQANYLADLDAPLRSFTDAKILRAKDDPEADPYVGDLICFPTPAGLGHSSLYLGKKLIISAKSTGIEIGTEEYEKDVHDRYARVRKFTGGVETDPGLIE